MSSQGKKNSKNKNKAPSSNLFRRDKRDYGPILPADIWEDILRQVEPECFADAVQVNGSWKLFLQSRWPQLHNYYPPKLLKDFEEIRRIHFPNSSSFYNESLTRMSLVVRSQWWDIIRELDKFPKEELENAFSEYFSAPTISQSQYSVELDKILLEIAGSWAAHIPFCDYGSWQNEVNYNNLRATDVKKLMIALESKHEYWVQMYTSIRTEWKIAPLVLAKLVGLTEQFSGCDSSWYYECGKYLTYYTKWINRTDIDVKSACCDCFESWSGTSESSMKKFMNQLSLAISVPDLKKIFDSKYD